MKKLTLVWADRSGAVVRLPGTHPLYSEQHKKLCKLLRIGPAELRLALLGTLIPGAPPVETAWAYYRYEDAEVSAS